MFFCLTGNPKSHMASEGKSSASKSTDTNDYTKIQGCE